MKTLSEQMRQRASESTPKRVHHLSQRDDFDNDFNSSRRSSSYTQVMSPNSYRRTTAFTTGKLPVIDHSQKRHSNSFQNLLKQYHDSVDNFALNSQPSQISINTMSRLSGIVEQVNSSGLFNERTTTFKPSNLCVKCGSNAAMCMACVEQDCENALTFYRKTRAAGAATLFNKAFVEAGNSKVVKFLIFRLLRNGFLQRKREQLKKRSVVEKLFGSNLVYIPFAAWRRYTKENIMNRKEQMISSLSEKLKNLEVLYEQQGVVVREQAREVSKYLICLMNFK